MAIKLMYVTVEMRELDDTATSVVNPSMPDISNTSQTQQPVVMTSLPRNLNDGEDIGTRDFHHHISVKCKGSVETILVLCILSIKIFINLFIHTAAATSCAEILMTVHTNKGFLSDSILT